MYNANFLNSKERNSLLKELKDYFGIKELKLDMVFVKNNEGKVYVVNNSLKEFNFSKLRINSFGMYFCKIEKAGIRLSIEGSQLLGPLATKNILDLNQGQLKEWVLGNEVNVNSDIKGIALVKHNDDFFGSGLVKNNILLNYFPKTRRMKVVNYE